MLISFSQLLCFLILIMTCFFFWLLQSFPTFSELFNEEGDEKVKEEIKITENIRLPAIVICNELPYTLAGLNLFSKNFKQDLFRRYLRSWFNPSDIDSIDFETMPEEDQKIAEAVVSEVLPNVGLKERLDHILLKCQDFLSSCIIDGESISGFDCCQSVEPFLSTLHGICWIFRNKTFIQNAWESRFTIQLTLQIAKNSYISNSQITHPGLSIFLSPDYDLENRMLTATELHNPFYKLHDKRQTNVFITKEVEKISEHKNCLSKNNRFKNSNFTICLLDAAVQQCSCVPLIAVLWTLQNDIDVFFLRRFDVSTICTVEQYNKCAKKFISQIQYEQFYALQYSDYNKNLKSIIKKCSRFFTPYCNKVTFKTTQIDESNLPQEYQNSPDFVAKFSIAYNSYQVKNIVHYQSTNFWKKLTIIGYNFALWFAVGHFIWSCITIVYAFFYQPRCKIQPRQKTLLSSPIQLRPWNQNLSSNNSQKSNVELISDSKMLRNGDSKISAEMSENLKNN